VKKGRLRRVGTGADAAERGGADADIKTLVAYILALK
jgi:hypothetical protein